MADGGMLGGSKEVNSLAQAATGKISFFKEGVLKPLAIGVGAGGLGVVVVRYFTKDMFRKRLANGQLDLTAANGLPQDVDGNSKFKRGGVKVLAGVIAASVVRKYSPVAALGIALGCGIDGVADMAEAKGFYYLDKWFKSSTTTGTTASGVSGGRAGGSTWGREVH